MADVETMEDVDYALSPSYRALSPSPCVSPTFPSLSCPPLDHSFSSASESTSRISTGSSRQSNVSNTSNTSNISKRRGYVRPQGATFAASAKNRDSVMSLGSIAHLQYYFARTGLLDGKGAQLAREKRKVSGQGDISSIVDSGTASPRTPSSLGFDDVFFGRTIGEDEEYDYEWEIDPLMLPPTVSTYNHKEQYIPPPPETETLRRELLESLEYVSTTLSNVREERIDRNARAKELLRSGRSTPPFAEYPGAVQSPSLVQRSPGRGWHEIQGMHVLDVVTLAIRAAKDYYTMHEHPLRLNKVKSERQLREELLGVMDVLKRMGIRGFAGGMKPEEISTIEAWTNKVRDFLDKEKDVEAQEMNDRRSWQWLEGDWAPNDRKREWHFLNTFIDGEILPDWGTRDYEADLPNHFLQKLSNGLVLIYLHNAILKKSKRQYGEIKSFHIDFAKHYRAADNLRFWIKAAEIRWEIKLELDVMGLVYNKGPEFWLQFDTALMQWCKVVREEITKEWKAGSVQVGGAAIPIIRHSDLIA